MQLSKGEKICSDEVIIRRTSPEKALICALLSRSMLDLESRSIEIRRGARAWLCSKRKTSFSFCWVCEELELNPETLLQMIQNRQRRFFNSGSRNLHAFLHGDVAE